MEVGGSQTENVREPGEFYNQLSNIALPVIILKTTLKSKADIMSQVTEFVSPFK